MKTNNLLILTLIVVAVLFWACVAQKISRTEKTYAETQKASRNTTCTYKLPVIKPTGKTTQSQTKGGVIITTSIVPFTAMRKEKQEKDVAYADPNKPGYDVFEFSNTPYYSVTPEDIQFKISIRNNEAVPLKLSEVGFALIIDGTDWSFPSGYLDDWNKGIIVSGFSKDYTIKGPQLAGLYNAQVVYLFLNGVPTSYNEAGEITKKSNFEWYFECKSEEVQKPEQINYTYETSPIYKERCSSCSGVGYFEKTVTCGTCSGKGSYYSTYSKKTVTCGSCSGNGRVQQKDYCSNCGGKGEKSFPKSKMPPVTSSITWNGWWVNVVTIPSGATIKAVTTKAGEYAEAPCTSPCKIGWYCTGGKTCPIIIEYNGQTVKVLPFKTDGSESPKVIVDFSSGTPFVKKGQKVN